jgi:single-strand DNA-binding protein
MNNIVVSGRLTKDPECKEFDEGKAVCDFTIAINGYKKEDTIYMKIKAWDGRARSCSKFTQKGSLINVSGSLRENSWKNKDGQQRKELYILASDIEFVQKPQDQSSLQGSEQTKPSEAKPSSTEKLKEVTEEQLEEVPF